MSFRPAQYACGNVTPHMAHQHTDGPDGYFYSCPGMPARDKVEIPDEAVYMAADAFYCDAGWEGVGELEGAALAAALRGFRLALEAAYPLLPASGGPAVVLPVCENCGSAHYTCGGCGVVVDAVTAPGGPAVDRQDIIAVLDRHAVGALVINPLSYRERVADALVAALTGPVLGESAVEEQRPDDDPAPVASCNGRDCGGQPHE